MGRKVNGWSLGFDPISFIKTINFTNKLYHVVYVDQGEKGLGVYIIKVRMYNYNNKTIILKGTKT